MSARPLAVVVVLGALLLAPRSAAAHDVRGEVLLLDIGQDVVGVELRAPVRQLELARRSELGPSPRAAVAEQRDALVAEVARAVGATTPDGEAFAPRVREVAVEREGDGDVFVARLDLVAPPGASARAFDLRDDLLLRTLTSATVYVFVRSDLQLGLTGEAAPAWLGYLHYQQRALRVDRTAGRWTTALATAVALGVRHIAEGTDHLLFLLVLLLPAPLIAAGGRWVGRRSARATLIGTAGVATAFTLGHSVTLAVGVIGGALVPARVVETAVAASILVSAAHAWRPLVPGREVWIAGGFGLVHGLAFASALAGLGLDRGTLAVSLLGFNLGVEAMQLCALAVTLPLSYVLARRPGYRVGRRAAAVGAGLVAAAWILERAAGIATPLSRMAAHPSWLLGGLAVVVVGAALVAGQGLGGAMAAAPRAAVARLMLRSRA